jgi:hypothetical protein
VSTTSVRKSSRQPAQVPTAPSPRGRVIFVGTGPGDPDLLTLGAIAALADAGAVILDSEQQQELLAHPAITLSPDAEVSTLGPTEAGKPLTPSARAKLVLMQASSGARVVRLVTGDPFERLGAQDVHLREDRFHPACEHERLTAGGGHLGGRPRAVRRRSIDGSARRTTSSLARSGGPPTGC